jgi:hypothetical protein
MTVFRLIRNIPFARAVTALLAVMVLNFSIDPPDNATHLKEDLTVNEIESIAEFACETLLELEGFFPEGEDNDAEHLKFQYTHYLLHEKAFLAQDKSHHLIAITTCREPERELLEAITDLPSPPPRLI